ncbi:uncharacterized protein LOC142238877 [Haematobia irritans]|uniref:uncharacterized protein LOC142229243 n=1 Tax=Haematobia irritans TaxID=7368 RepID=UPI003F4FFC12
MDEEKLIEAVKKYPILFDLQCREYKNTQKKEDVWKGISNEIGWSTELCKKKWKNLRDTYKKTKQRLNMPSGSGAEVKRTWKYFENMSFLDNVKSNRRTIGNIFDETLELNESYEEISPLDDYDKSMSNDEDYKYPQQKRKREDDFPSILTTLRKTADQIANTTTNKTSTECLFESLHLSIKNANLSLEQTSELEDKIFVFVKNELADIRQQRLIFNNTYN